MKINLPKNAKKIIEILEKNDYEGYVVGGCVRDSIMGVTPKDWDICTNATPDKMLEIFKGYHVIETGLQHGTITIMLDHEPYEVTTFRLDGEYSDNRHPDKVEYVSEIKEDLSRRDFTINAMAYCEKSGLIDIFGGVKDIENKMIKCVGNPNLRFNEDALRIMRALRFASTLGFEIEEKTSIEIVKLKNLLENIALERINSELRKMLVGKGVEDIILNYCNVLSVVISQIGQMKNFTQNNPYHCYNLLGHTAKAVAMSQNNEIVAITMLLHDIGKLTTKTTDEKGIDHFYKHPIESENQSKKILKNLRFDNNTISTVTTLIQMHDNTIAPSKKSVKKVLAKIGYDNFYLLLKIKKADILAQAKDKMESRLQELEIIEEIAKEVQTADECICIKQLKVNGNDIKAMGFTNGKNIGLALNYLLENVINGNFKNDKQFLSEKIVQFFEHL